MAEYPLSIVLRTVDKSTTALRAIEARFDRFGGKLDKISQRASKIGKGLTTSLTLPIVGIGVAGVRAMSEFEDGMSNVSTLVDESEESMGEMGKRVLEISRRTPVALEDLTAALYDTRSAGVDAGDAMTVLEQSARLGVAGLGTTAEAVDLVTSSMNAFGLEGEAAENVYDNIFKTVKNGKTNIAELSQGFGAVAGTVAATGTPLDEYLASVAALTTTGLPAAVAHTQIRGAMAALTKDTAKTRKIFKKLGATDLKDLIQKSGGFVEALKRINVELDGDSAKILKLVGRTEAMGAIIGLTGGQNEAFTATLEDMREGANAVDKAFGKQSKTASAGWKRTKNALTSAGISIGKILTPTLEKVAEKLELASAWFENLDDGTKDTLVTIAGVAATVGPALFVFGKIASTVAMITKAVKLLSLAMTASPIGAVVAGIVAIKAITGDDFSTIFSDAIAFWKEHLGAVFRWIENRIKDITASIDDAVAHFTGGETSAEKSRRRIKNIGIRQELSDRVQNINMAQIRMDVVKRRASVAASETAFDALAARKAAEFSQPAGGAGGISKIEIDIKGAPQGTTVRTKSDERQIDVTTGYQMGGD